MNQNWQNILKERFGFDEFRGHQGSAIEQAMTGGHSLTIMPTGQGKSLCYQFASLLLPDLVLVISPLIALMKDQVQEAQKKDLKAIFINSSLDATTRKKRYQEIKNGQHKILFVTPERLRKKEFQEVLAQRKISLLAIDEAHCISQWGHDFRPDYSRLGEFKKSLGDPPTMALTATATPEVQKDILKQLNIEDSPVFSSGVRRDNLSLSVIDLYGLDSKVRAIVNLIHQTTAAAGVAHLNDAPSMPDVISDISPPPKPPLIIYFSLVQSLEKTSHELDKLGIEHVIYHGQLPSQQRSKAQDSFLKGRCHIILATPAFGLGVHKSDIRLIIHAEVPGSLEAYYQEVGRAGRDGRPAQGVLLYDADDIAIQTDFLKWSLPEPQFINTVFELLNKNYDRFKMEGVEYLRKQMNFYNSRDFRVETTLNLLERGGWLMKDQKFKYALAENRNPQSPLEFYSEEDFKNRQQQMQKKLLTVVEFAQTEECRMQNIYEYFGEPIQEPCGTCDNCMQ